MKSHRLLLAVLLTTTLTVTNGIALAVTGSVFTVAVPGGEMIDRAKDHFAVTFEDGWVSKEDGWLSRLFSESKAGLFTISGAVTFDDSQLVKIEYAMPLEDPKKTMARSLGFRGLVYPDLPADVTQIDLSLRIALTNEDRFTKLLGALDSSKAGLPAEVFSAPWIGYARMVSVVSQSIFGTNDSDYPLSARYSVSMPAKEHYVIMVASNKEGDGRLSAAIASDFTYDNQKLLFKNGPAPRDWTYFVLKIKKNLARKSVNQRAVGLDTPWATVIRTQLNVLPVAKAKTEQQFSAIADNTLTAIQNLGTFLVADRSFSNYDRAAGIYYFADNSVRTLKEACQARKIAHCPVEDIEQYRRQMAMTFRITEANLASAASAMRLQAAFEKQLASTNSQSRYTLLPYLSDWETYIASNPKLNNSATLKSEGLPQMYKGVLKNLDLKLIDRQAWDFVTQKAVTMQETGLVAQ